ncbi:PIN domain-containing protein [Nonomuraea polychroma]|uniref:PIN domain-containing protein n=1 Tax=Nonomuraea polychroma TaxID=46176 RepID=UPI003D8CF0AE
MISTELDERVIALDAAVTALRAQITRWCRPGRFAVPDTSLFIEHLDRIESMDLRPLLGIRDEPVHLLLPIVVIDELDNLKQANGTHERWRARQALRIIDERLTNPLEPAELQPEDYTLLDNGGIPRGQVTMEMVFDPPGHVRLPIADDEIVGCALGGDLPGRGRGGASPRGRWVSANRRTWCLQVRRKSDSITWRINAGKSTWQDLDISMERSSIRLRSHVAGRD